MIARAALRSSLRAAKAPSPLAQLGARRGYAEAVSDKLKLSFILPHEEEQQTHDRMRCSESRKHAAWKDWQSWRWNAWGAVDAVVQVTLNSSSQLDGSEEEEEQHGMPLASESTANAIYNSTEVTQVNIAASTGDMGILASHVPSVEELRPGVLEVVESSGTKKWFVSGGFATVHPNNKLVVNAIEAYPLDNFSTEAVRSALSEAQRVASSSSSAEAKAEAEIEIEVYTALQAALGRS
ncbi:hypothetical protein PaG_04987 [Moesziomyces aphidis]|uniref:ATP synthase subunit delta, mitochondrial n=1 Tax=Moesziomyces aphidis TaxID=84754 RepID=W3VHK9_MOEAP|nr:hypothetical protein PaG_04987 [Moesziomyces aphidis]